MKRDPITRKDQAHLKAMADLCKRLQWIKNCSVDIRRDLDSIENNLRECYLLIEQLGVDPQDHLIGLDRGLIIRGKV